MTAAENLMYRPAKRGNAACLIMISGPSGTGKTFSALRLARGLAGPNGKICLADTDNNRSKFYADDFVFFHHPIEPPFRPIVFEKALEAALSEKADVVLFDNFSAEHDGPGGILDYHEDELQRLTRGDLSKRDGLNMVAWIKPKTEHKKLLQALYRKNVHIILCCSAARKIAMVKQTEGRDRGKVVPVDQGLQPICGEDVPYAMTIALMLSDVSRPGVPTPIKALMPPLKPIVSLEQPLDEQTGARIAAWARGDSQPAKAPSPANELLRDPAVDNPPSNSGSVDLADSHGPPTPDDGLFPGDIPLSPPPARRASKNEQVLASLIRQFEATKVREDHLRIVDEKGNRDRIDWFKKNKPELYRPLRAAMEESWARTDPRNQEAA